MKRILVFILTLSTLLCMTVALHAQQVTVLKSAQDTLVNADTSYIMVNAPDDTKSIQIVVKRHSGTAAGRAVLKATNDGSNYFAVGVDTLTFSNAAVNTHKWVISPLYYGQYYIELISSGTTKLTANGYMVRRKT